jgi:RNA polymerase sigma-70 factor (ECF subfamily)
MRTPDSDIAGQFSKMYEDLYGHVHTYAARRVGREAADEIAADTFLVAWRRFDQLPSQPLPWLYGVARNVVLRHRSALARQEVTRQAVESEPDFTRTEGNDSALWEAWHQLSDRDREVLALVAWEELPIGDAARALRCSPATFSVRLHRARRRLERRLQQPHSLSDSTPALSEVT